MMREEEFIRADAPLFAQPEECESYYQHLIQVISRYLNKSHMKDFYVHHMAQFLPLQEFSFPFALHKEGPSEEEIKKCYFAWIPKVFPFIFQEEDSVSFESDRRKWEFAMYRSSYAKSSCLSWNRSA